MEKPIKLFVTDTHKDKNNLQVIEDIFDQAFDLAEQLGIDEINHLGDIFTERTGQALSVLLSLKRVIEKAQERQIKIVAIAGNHDKTNLESEQSYLDIFDSDVFEVVRPYSIRVNKTYKMIHCYIPYYKEDTEYLKLLKEVTTKIQSKIDDGYDAYLYTHIAVSGVRNNGGTKVENQLKYSLFKPFKKVFVGHYHNQSRIGKNIFYIGSGLPKDFGEDDKKGFTVLYSDGKHEFIQSNFRKFVKVTVDLDKTNKKELESLLKQYAGSEDFVRFIFVGSKEQFVQFSGQFNMLKKAGIDVKTEDKNILKAMEVAKIGGKITFNYKLIKRYFLEFCSKNKEQITPERRKRGMAYVDILKQYEDVES